MIYGQGTTLIFKRAGNVAAKFFVPKARPAGSRDSRLTAHGRQMGRCHAWAHRALLGAIRQVKEGTGA